MMLGRWYPILGSTFLGLGLAAGCGSDVTDGATGGGPQGASTTSVGGAGAGGGGGAGGSDGGMAPDPCAPLQPGLQAALEASYTAESAPKGGVLIAASTDACPFWAGSVGDENLESAALFKIGVTSKMLVAATVLLLMEDGVLSIDDAVDAWVPSVPEGVTIRHLLDHTSGLLDYIDNPEFMNLFTANPKTVWTPAELVQYAIDAGPPGAPGTTWKVKWIDYLLLGEVIESATLQPVHEVVRDRVITPLSLDDTYLAGPEGDFADVIPGYNGNGIDVSTSIDPSFWGVGAAYVSNAIDTVALTRGILTGDLLSADSHELMTTLTVPTYFNTMRYGLGVVIDTGEGHPRVGQEGALPGFEVRTFYATELDAVVVIAATNHEWATLKPLLDALNTIAAAKTF